MCEANAFLIRDGKKELLLESVDEVEIGTDEVRLINIFGEQRILNARFRRYSAADRELVFEAN
ncbi:MAG: CooT family nickel-binding protein [Desulfatiglandales bacterium]